MRALILLLAVLVAVGLVGLLVVRSDEPGGDAARGTVSLLGDSLNVGVEPYLSEVLRGWTVIADDMVGRRTEEGIAELEARRLRLSTHVVVSLGTNDPPPEVDAFRADVQRVLRLIGAGRCVVWSTIWRDGEASAAFNEVLREAASSNRRLRLVDWAAMVSEHPDWLSSDGLHGNDVGYRKRAEAIADAVRGCRPEPGAAAQ